MNDTPTMQDFIYLAKRQKIIEDAVIRIEDALIAYDKGMSEWSQFLTVHILKGDANTYKKLTKLQNDIKYKTHFLKEELKKLSESHQGIVQFVAEAQQRPEKKESYAIK